MRTFLAPSLLFTACTLHVTAQPDKTDAEQRESALPALKVLPAGSSLKRVRVPRYTSDYQPASLLTADVLKIINNDQVDGTNVSITLYQNGVLNAQTHMNAVTYNQLSGIVHATENILIHGQEFDTASQGLALHWEKRTGFLLGKTQTLFYSNTDKKMISKSPATKTNSSPRTISRPRKIQSAATGLAIAASAAPTLLSARDIQQLDILAAPMTQQIHIIDQQAEQESKSIQQIDTSISQSKQALQQDFSQTINITQTEQVDPQQLELREEPVFISLTSDDGMYFDAEKGIIVYSKNIVVVHPQYKLNCDDELKVLLLEKVADPTDPAAPVPAEEETDVKKAKKFSGIDKAIATGSVRITGKDKAGKIIVATAETATYDGVTGDMILKGGSPSITHGDTKTRILSKDGYIKITSNMSIRIKGKHNTTANLKTLKPDSNKP